MRRGGIVRSEMVRKRRGMIMRHGVSISYLLSVVVKVDEVALVPSPQGDRHNKSQRTTIPRAKQAEL